MYYVYILENKLKGQIYTGSTNNLERRLAEHNSGKEISTKRYMPWALIYYEAYATEELARQREKKLKYNGNAIRELKRRIGGASPSTAFQGRELQTIAEQRLTFSKRAGYKILKSGAGFTLVEVLVVTAIIATLSVALFFNFGTTARNRTARSQVASVIVSDIRRAQSMALSGARFGGNIFCGYGIHYVDNITYILYAGSNEGLPQCQSANHNYQSGIDTVVETKKLVNQNMEFRSSFSDIFFESPDPKTYINNNASLAPPIPTATITIQRVGQAACSIPQTCAQIDISTSGQLNLSD